MLKNNPFRLALQTIDNTNAKYEKNENSINLSEKYVRWTVDSIPFWNIGSDVPANYWHYAKNIRSYDVTCWHVTVFAPSLRRLNAYISKFKSIKISAAALPWDKCCTEITVAADLVPKARYISSIYRTCRNDVAAIRTRLHPYTGMDITQIRKSNCFDLFFTKIEIQRKRALRDRRYHCEDYTREKLVSYNSKKLLALITV